MTVAAAWIDGDWIFSRDAAQSAKFWIADGWVWGPIGSPNINTKYWIADGWIWGPAGAANVMTNYFIQDGWIFGPQQRLPFARQIDHRWRDEKIEED